MLDVGSLSARYGAAKVIEDLNLFVGAEEAVALMGRNGAGKSTTLKAIMGLLRNAAGKVRFLDHEIMGLPAHRICQLGIGYVPEDRRVFPDLTVMENLEVGRRPARFGLPAWRQDCLLYTSDAADELRGLVLRVRCFVDQ